MRIENPGQGYRVDGTDCTLKDTKWMRVFQPLDLARPQKSPQEAAQEAGLSALSDTRKNLAQTKGIDMK